jgi:CheY-like chemotaxis protein
MIGLSRTGLPSGSSGETLVVAKRVLVVEDDDDHRDICATILRHHNYEVMEAGNGEEALHMAREQRPDLILMDAVLPILNGWDATKLRKASPVTGRIPVVMLTARALGPDLERSVAAGADSFLTKPIDPGRVVDEVRRFIGSAREP